MKTKGLKKNLSLDKVRGIRIDTGPVTYVPVIKEYKFPTPEKVKNTNGTVKKDGWKYQEENIMKNWIKDRIEERTSWNGAALIAVGVVVLIAGPFAKLAAYAAIAYGVWAIYSKED